MKSMFSRPAGNRPAKKSRFFCPFFTRGLVFGFIFFAALNLAAQEDDARIYHVEGTDFALTQHGERDVYPADAAGGEGIRLERSGIVHTGAGTLLELQIPSGTVIKLSENTSLVYNGIDETGKFADMGLLYGRIRVVTGAGSVVVRGGGVSARLAEGDLGVDYILEPDRVNSVPRPLFQVYALRGSVEVFPYGKGGTAAYFGGVQALSVEQGEGLSVDISSSYTFAEKKPVDKAILAYWSVHNFAGAAPLPMPDTVIAAASEAPSAAVTPAAPPPVYEAPARIIPDGPAQSGQELAAKTNYRRKNIILGLGLFLTVSAVAVQGISYSQFNTSRDDFARNLYMASYVPLSMGLITTLTGILYDPSFSRK